MQNAQPLDPRIAAAFPFDLKREADLIVAAFMGSISHNTYVPKDDSDAIDDVDILGAVLPPPSRLLGLDPWTHFTLQQDELDVTIFSLRRLVELWLKSNPNVLGLLWLRPEHYLYRSEAFDAFVAIRDAFASMPSPRSRPTNRSAGTPTPNSATSIGTGTRATWAKSAGRSSIGSATTQRTPRT